MEFELDTSILQLVSTACRLGAHEYGGALSPAEAMVVRLARGATTAGEVHIQKIRAATLHGDDPLGETYQRLRERRARQRGGIFYTNRAIVAPMVEWLLSRSPDRVIDAGCGSGRFAQAVANRMDTPSIVAVDTDPIATLLCRANLAVIGRPRVTILNADFASLPLEPISGRTGFVGNPPYVRHHDLTDVQKSWSESASARLGHKLSKLAGLHAHFFFATGMHAKPGDVGCYITSSEWLDTSYGSGVRELLLNGLGIESLHLFDHNASPFPDAMTTAAITCFEVGRSTTSVMIRNVRSTDELAPLGSGQPVQGDGLAAKKWGTRLRGGSERSRNGLIRLGDFVSVHRGAVTGRNDFFVMSRQEANERGLARFVRPVLTSAKEVLRSSGVIRASQVDRVVLAPPRDTDVAMAENDALREYLREGERLGVPETYICSHRMPWWYIGFKEPPPVVATYMARQPPAFAFNPDGIVILNVLHGLYPKIALSKGKLEKFAQTLNRHRHRFGEAGRFYHGGLQKLEPRDMEELLVAPPLTID